MAQARQHRFSESHTHTSANRKYSSILGCRAWLIGLHYTDHADDLTLSYYGVDRNLWCRPWQPRRRIHRRRDRDAEGVEWGARYGAPPQLTRGVWTLEERRKLPSGAWGGDPAENEFWCRPYLELEI